ncbi:Abnormal spindle-like microcephaly-assoc'd, ASPM-SPD-2-Hydin [Lutibacter agarilyticus]|uniref:Abnormal spindle-like microcephaly-assoc'd, ASPM-SPD-2-Hydin n=1 Tax=Lutibacter agarilyticus TaxID=1109740 RepID=A0A238WHW2_9FLAO|nr:choice-of-anchor D domain-containing protein [Lutibacter agarilyticus]SNR46130.1 Abnormal spindle-like microcephaly-assoc'd, ASPM-SPD-2-Hydin [Lutibacter agarilyticus]
MKIKIFLITVLFLGFSNSILSQNVLSVETKGVTTATEFELAISLENTDGIAAIQFDINYNANEFELLTGHSLTSRGANHSLGLNSISEGVVRVLIYNFTTLNIIGNSGGLMLLKLKSKNNSGDYPFTLSNVDFSSSSAGSISSTIQNGVITVLGPKMEVLESQVYFGSVLLGSNQTRSLPIRNSGNQPLEITGINDVFPFSIQGGFPIDIPAHSTTYLAVSIDTSTKFNGSKELSFVNNDPDLVRGAQKVILNAVVYAVNTIRIGGGSAEINSEIEIPVSVDNMEDFTGFQFDITLPEGIEYVPNSIIETSRFDDHLIGVNLIDGNTLRFIGYSPSNKNFTGNSGELFSFKLKPTVSSGYFGLNVSNAILTNIAQENILSNSYSGSIQINSPNLSITPLNINFGSVPITKTQQTSLRLTNTGNASLLIDEVVYDNSELSLDIQLPLTIPVGSYQDVNLDYTPLEVGDFEEAISFKNNGLTEQNTLSVQASAFSPNYVMVKNQEVYRNETNMCQILLKNKDLARGVQFDVELPIDFTLDIANVSAVGRAEGFDVAASSIGGTSYRVILYTLSSSSISVGGESIIQLPISIAGNVGLGNYKFNFSNVIISDTSNADINSSALEIGELTLVDKVSLGLKMFLQGPFSNPSIPDLMNDDLRLSNLPTTSPYSDAVVVNPNVFNTGGISGLGLVKDDIVDWVWIELRDALNNETVISGKSGLIQRDGDIVAVDGVSVLSYNVNADDYYVAINHRNHLGILSSTSLFLSSTPLSVDFTTDVSLIQGGSNAVLNVSNNLTLIGGDYDSNGQVQNTDISNIVLQLGGSGYSNADLDMNGQIQNTDINNIINANLGRGQQF